MIGKVRVTSEPIPLDGVQCTGPAGCPKPASSSQEFSGVEPEPALIVYGDPAQPGRFTAICLVDLLNWLKKRQPHVLMAAGLDWEP